MTTLPTLIDQLNTHAQRSPEKVIYRFMDKYNEETLTFKTLHQKVSQVAYLLQAQYKDKAPVLIMLRPGLDFIVLFLACLAAKVIPVPVYPPFGFNLNKSAPRIRHICQDTQAELIITSSQLKPQVESEFSKLNCLAFENFSVSIESESRLKANLEDLAFIQYTSGSTYQPKGVMLSHENLSQNLAAMELQASLCTDDRCVSWLPPYHDLGLIACILQALYTGFELIMMSPVSFLKDPSFWLKTISKFKATLSGAPNFAYELCCQKVSDDILPELDLSHWQLAFSAAEPVRINTLEKFAKKFEAAGFNKNAFYPAYGLAESTVFLTGGQRNTFPNVDCLKQKKEDAIVSCGPLIQNHHIAIVNPDSLCHLSDGQIGEIWVSGPSIASGYFNQTKESHATFNNRLNTYASHDFLRTGDLGYMKNNELYVTGRLKELIIIRGQNFYPQDIEYEIENGTVNISKTAVFAVESDNDSRLVVIQECALNLSEEDLQRIVDDIRFKVSDGFGLTAYQVLLIRPGALPKTSSGKIQRRYCKALFLADEFAKVYTSDL